ncbi:MAG TPA: cation-transporting P-type ATPase [Polyangiaceae bacterium]
MDALSTGGLTSAEAEERLGAVGPNSLPPLPARSLRRRILAQFESALSLLLLGAATLDFVLWGAQGRHGFPLEPVAILIVLAINAALGVLQEYRSEHALHALETLGQPFAWVLRDGTFAHLPAEAIVPGDCLRIEAGDRIPADGAVLEQASLAVDESILTGESVAVDKSTGDGVSSGTLVVRGMGLVRIEATGAASNMGRLTRELSRIETARTPLERRMDAFGRRIAWIAGALVAALVVLGIASEGLDRAGFVVTFAIAFAVAVVPEGMPAMVTLTLALGVERMARRRAVVRRLAAVEALGSVTVVATDKTGTLTENRARVAEVLATDERQLVEAAALANDAEPDGKLGDPLDLALLAYAAGRGVDAGRLRAVHRRISSRPFDAAWRYSRVTVEGPAGVTSYLKGAFEVMLARATIEPAEADRLHAFNEREARGGRRVIAIGRAPGEREDGLELLGLVSVWDPPRESAAAAITAVQRAGIRVLMVTGDHPTTAGAIAERVGIASPRIITGDEFRSLPDAERAERIASADVIARATAEDKLTIVEALQRSEEVVAMTGDGVNDAPALKRADIGVAMGQRGSDVAREVSDLVLLDDDFGTVARALDEGRNIYDNIQKFIRFTFSTNVALAIVILGGAAGSYWLDLRDATGGLVLPLTAIQVLFINFVGDGAPALALALDRNPGVMLRKPRGLRSPLLDAPAVRFILFAGILQGSVGLGLLLALPEFGFGLAAIQTLVFVYESAAKVLSVYPARRVSGKPAPNRALHAAAALGLGLTAACALVPALRSVLGLTTPSLAGLSIVGGCVLATLGVTQTFVSWSARAGALARES